MKQRSIVFGRTAITFLIGALLFVGFASYFFVMHESLWAWISVACAVFFLISASFVPLFYVLDKKGIRIRYFTGDKENYEWKNVKRICAEYDSVIPFIFDTYRIDGDDYTVYMFYKEGRLERSKRLATLIKTYFGKDVEGLIPEGLSAGAARRFKQSYGKAIDSSAAQAAEREARKVVRAVISELGEGAKALTLEYAYFTADGKCDKRPSVDYTYSLELEKGGEAVGSITLVQAKRGVKAMKVTLTAEHEAVKAEIGQYV